MILVNNPGTWSHIFSPLKHAPWHGCTPTDLVFPFFLFAVGNAFAFVLPRFEDAGTSTFLRKVFKRTVLIFSIGLLLNWLPFMKWSGEDLVIKFWVDKVNPDTGVRILGVLQRIALCYFFAAVIIYFFKPKGAFVVSAVLLLCYWALCLWANPADPYSLEGWFGTAIDKKILGIPHMYKGEGIPFDPEGIMSTFPAIVQVVFGYFIGSHIRSKGATHEMLNQLFVTALLLVCTAYFWDLLFPINKKIWTSSYVLYTTGLATFTLALMVYLIEFRKVRGNGSRFFDVFGKNPLFIFVMSAVIPKTLSLLRWTDHTDETGQNVYISPLPWFYENICKPVSTDLRVGSLLYALIMVTFMWSLAAWLDRKKIYIRV
jgi:predicted acyltransferase